MIQVENLTKTFPPETLPVLAGVSFALEAGQTLAVIGPSGSGKTTLLYLLSGLLAPTAGRVARAVPGQSAPPPRTSFVLQDFGLFPWKTVARNVTLGLILNRVDRKEAGRIATALLAEMGLTGHAGKYPAQLSGGQKQRVALARALATDPELLLLDEPFSSLDALTREHLQETLLELWRRRNLTWILVTHGVEEAVFLGGRIIVLAGRPARIERIIENPGFGRSVYRSEPCFFEVVTQVRAALAQVAGATANGVPDAGTASS